ncbi:MAG: LicD family protein [Selenomonadaceae bacterium]|nr:LicD family protein [Selenomonadaceae bacterium]
MGKGTNKLDAITRQNELLEEQNKLLREQNDFLRKSKSVSAIDNQEVFIENIDSDEMRNGFLVTSHRKKLWNVQIGLLKEFDRICKKHDIKWFVFSGTLIGAVRHKGFIPWDDDVDVFMFRPDYEKFKRVVAQELQPPYFLDAWFNYRLESEESPDSPSDNSLQFVPLQQEKDFAGWFPFWPMIKIRDSRTSMIQWPNRKHVNQGIWIDIFAFDFAPPFIEKQQEINWQIAKELLWMIAFPDNVKKAMENNQRFYLPHESMKKFMGLKHKERTLQFESFMAKSFFDSECVADFRDYIIAGRKIAYNTKDFEKIIYLPFEKIEVPVPAGYENILAARYGDWHKLIYAPSHVSDYSVDISYKDYFAKVANKSPIKENDQIVGVLLEEQND